MGEKIDGLTPEEAADKAIDAIKKLAADIGVPSGLKDLGAKEEDFVPMTEMPCRISAGSQIQENLQKKILSIFTAKPCNEKTFSVTQLL